jgi:protein-L-isoaspartate(D-aspartate) O-methyltransferase
MVIPVGGQEVQRMLRITKMSDTEFDQEMFDNFSFVPMLAGKSS